MKCPRRCSRRFGWHLIQVQERRDQDITEQRKRLDARRAIRERKSEEAFEDWVRQARDRAYVEYRLEDNPMTIEASLIWQSRHASHCDRLLVADSALLADGRWARAAAEVRGVDGVETVNNASVELDAAPWLQPAGQPIAEIPISEFRLATAFPTPGRFYPRIGFPQPGAEPTRHARHAAARSV
jgi:hypothetical protein